MHWTEQTETMVKALAETQDEMWKYWLGQGGPASPAGQQQVVNDVTERLLTTQKEMVRVFELSLTAWQALVPKIESGEDWQATLRTFTDGLRQQFVQYPQEMQKALQDSEELWRVYCEQWNKLTLPWLDTLRRSPWHVGQASVGNGSALIEFSNMYWDAFERTFGRLLESPSLGYTRELNADILKGFDAWLDYRRASAEYQTTLSETWVQAFGEFLRQQVALAKKGDPVPGVRQLLFLWVDVVEHAFGEVFRSEHYIHMQANLVNTAAAYRLREREIVDAFLKTSHLASRSDLDEAYRRIYELRREVKELKKTVQAIKGDLSNTRKE